MFCEIPIPGAHNFEFTAIAKGPEAADLTLIAPGAFKACLSKINNFSWAHHLNSA